MPTSGGVWADLGSGTGAFTLALAELISADDPPSSGAGRSVREIYSVDRDRRALRTQERRMRARFPDVTVHYLSADLTRPLDLPRLDGVLMANSLHFVRDKDPVLRLVRTYLRPEGRLIVVEYDTDRDNAWVPHPFSFQTWEEMAARSGFGGTRLLHTRPSRFLGRIYSALSMAEQQSIAVGHPRLETERNA